MFKVNNKEIRPTLLGSFNVFIVNFEHILQLVLVRLLLTLSRLMPIGIVPILLTLRS